MILSDKCLQTFLNFELSSSCVKEVVVTALNIGVLIGSIGVKMPQILKIVKSGNVVGIAESSFVLEILAAMMSCLYHVLLSHPFAGWGEMLILGVQCIFQWVLFCNYTRGLRVTPRLALSAAMVGFSAFTLQGGLPQSAYALLGASPAVLGISSRLPQIILNFRQGHTGQVALITFALSGLGNLARVATTLSRTPDDLVSLVGHVAAAVCNGALVFQIVWYWTETSKKVARGPAKRKVQ